ncbi:MOXD1 2 protein [Blattella germanica]|nr:MOXD1 2 protein [Blattella germanica]
MIKYEPLLDTKSGEYMRHVILYECQGNEEEFEAHAQDRGQFCYQPSTPPSFFNFCNNVVIAWGIGSKVVLPAMEDTLYWCQIFKFPNLKNKYQMIKGFSFPPDVGYPLNSEEEGGSKYFMMETHYSIPVQDMDVSDSSGIRVYYTSTLRENDAGVLSVGLDPNWRHIIPPGQPDVVSEGHCIPACTQHTMPTNGINMFAATLHTHLIGRKVRLRQIRNGIELPPITADENFDPNYQEFRRLLKPVNIRQGDHLIAECVYNSVGRSTITLGGLTSREEMCLVFGYYYPRIDLSLCHSLPSLPTVLHSLGIQELWP